jgi:threonine/homoserine/homoserine lactone efflux protein
VIEVFAKALLLGVLLTLFVGPVFFMLIQASIRDGVKGGLSILLGLYLSDLLYIILTYYFFSLLITLEIPEAKIKLAGGVVFIILGVFYFLKKKSKITTSKSTYKNNYLKSFIINTLNPSAFFFWFAVLSWGNQHFNNKELIIYLGLGLLFALLFDFLKIYFSIYIAKLINSKSSSGFNKVIGAVIIFIGITLVYQNS